MKPTRLLAFVVAAALLLIAIPAAAVTLQKLSTTLMTFAPTTGTVASNAVTTNAAAGVITDDATDINASSTRADIAWTNSFITATSVIIFSECKKPADANVNIVARVTPSSGSATLSLRNTGTGNLTTNGDAVICFLIVPP